MQQMVCGVDTSWKKNIATCWNKYWIKDFTNIAHLAIDDDNDQTAQQNNDNKSQDNDSDDKLPLYGDHGD